MGIDSQKIRSYFGENKIAKYIQKMLTEQEIYVWQYQSQSDSQWTDVDMMLSHYLSILPLDEAVDISMKSSQTMSFSLIRQTVSKAILIYECKDECVEYKLNRISKSMENGVYIPDCWEKELLNRSISKTYLHSIDLDVFVAFGEYKYANWYGYLRDYVKEKKIGSIASVENWSNYHAFNCYSNWQCATSNGYKMKKLWYLEKNSIKGREVMKNGFMNKQQGDTNARGWTFCADLQNASVGNVIILCSVCIDEKNEKELKKNGSCKLRHSLCAYPELYIKLTK